MEVPHATNVLIVEDNRDTAESLRLVFKGFGITSEVVGSLREALARLGCDGIDCVVLDLSLPDSNGLTAAETLQEKYPNVPFVINTGYEDLAIQAIQVGAQDVIVKPGTPDTWQRRILYAIARHKVRRKFEPVRESLEKVIATTGKLIESVEPGSVHFGRIEP